MPIGLGWSTTERAHTHTRKRKIRLTGFNLELCDQQCFEEMALIFQ